MEYPILILRGVGMSLWKLWVKFIMGRYCTLKARLYVFLRRYIDMSLYQKTILCSMGYCWDMLRADHSGIGGSMDAWFHD